MFPVIRDGNAYKRMGAFVVVPLTDDAAKRLLAGNLFEGDIKESDVQSPSRYVYLSQNIEPDLTTIGQRQFSVAQTHCVFYQIACLTRETTQEDPPTIITVYTNEDYKRRLRRHGFQETGVLMAKTPAQIVKLDPAGYGLRETAAYWLCYTILMAYRKANAGSPEWKQMPGGSQ